MYNMDKFADAKLKLLSKIDRSIKGSIDSRVFDLVNYINELDSYYTTSSCSGRIVVFGYSEAEPHSKSKGCTWVYTTHRYADHTEIMEKIRQDSGTLVFKMEPFILHVRCKTLAHAQTLHALASEAGFKNSGLTVSKAGNVTLAIRSCLRYEVPVTEDGRVLISSEYCEYLVLKANNKMKKNWDTIQRLHDILETELPLDDDTETDTDTEDERSNCTNKRQSEKENKISKQVLGETNAESNMGANETSSCDVISLAEAEFFNENEVPTTCNGDDSLEMNVIQSSS